jgi:hypothetical protein
MAPVMITQLITVQLVIGMEEIVARKPVWVIVVISIVKILFMQQQVLQPTPLPPLQANPLPALQLNPLPALQLNPLPALQPNPLATLQLNPLPPPQPLFAHNSSHLMIPTGLMNYGPPHSSNSMVTSKSLMTMMMMMTLFTSLVTSLPCTSSRLLALGESSPP